MDYTKPEVALGGSAFAVIQGNDKPPDFFPENALPIQLIATVCAYQADE